DGRADSARFCAPRADPRSAREIVRGDHGFQITRHLDIALAAEIAAAALFRLWPAHHARGRQLPVPAGPGEVPGEPEHLRVGVILQGAVQDRIQRRVVGAPPIFEGVPGSEPDLNVRVLLRRVYRSSYRFDPAP